MNHGEMRSTLLSPGDRMFNLFNRAKNTSDPQDEEYTEAVILTVPLESGLDLGSADEHDGVIKLEEELESIVHSNEIVDGHEFGEETAILYLYGPSADELFDRVKGILKNSIFDRFEVNLRYGPADDLKAQEKNFTLSW